jgi:hypothetical protein
MLYVMYVSCFGGSPSGEAAKNSLYKKPMYSSDNMVGHAGGGMGVPSIFLSYM